MTNPFTHAGIVNPPRIYPIGTATPVSLFTLARVHIQWSFSRLNISTYSISLMCSPCLDLQLSTKLSLLILAIYMSHFVC